MEKHGERKHKDEICGTENAMKPPAGSLGPTLQPSRVVVADYLDILPPGCSPLTLSVTSVPLLSAQSEVGS